MELEIIKYNLSQLTKLINIDILHQRFDPNKIYITTDEPVVDEDYNIFINLDLDKNYMGQALYLYTALIPYDSIGEYIFNYYKIKHFATLKAIY